MSIFRRTPQPPPESFFKKNPIPTIAIIITVIGMFVLGPIGVIYKGMTEELEKKADNETVIILLKQIKENDDRQWKEIEKNREEQKQIMLKPKAVVIEKPEIPTVTMKRVEQSKAVLTPEQFEKYINMEPNLRSKYKLYLKSTGKDVSNLPD